MKYFFLVFWFLIATGKQFVMAQEGLAEGYFTSEANVSATDNGIFVSIKKYNPSKEEINSAASPSKNTPMNYLMLPFDAGNVSMYDKGFESKLYFLDNQGKMLWDQTLGYSNKSTASPLIIYKNFIYTGESAQKDDKVVIRKMNMDGKLAWQTELDSLHNVNAIYADDKKVSALVSFDVSKKMEHSNGTYSEHIYPIYFFVQFDINTGKKITKEYQKMANYLSSLDFTNPLLNTDHSYFLNTKDSAIFFSTANLEGATVVSQGMSKNNSIIKVAAGSESYHLLTTVPEGSRKKYQLISDFYGKKVKYVSEFPVDHSAGDRVFVFRSTADTIITAIGNSRGIGFVKTDPGGQSIVVKKTEKTISPIIAAGIISGRIFVLQMQDRMKPGKAGRIQLDFY